MKTALDIAFWFIVAIVGLNVAGFVVFALIAAWADYRRRKQ